LYQVILPNSSKIRTRRETSPKRAVLTAAQCRAARSWLGWSRDELAAKANVSLRTIAAFERDEIKPRTNILTVIRSAIEAAGIRLLFDLRDGTAAGILRRDADPDLPSEPSN
jgi:ribosome-binding protein aMBF1 (putative translation factor)